MTRDGGEPQNQRGTQGVDRRAAHGSERPPVRDRRSGIEMTPHQLARRRRPSFTDGPVLSLVAIAVTLTLAVLCLGVGFSRPLYRQVPLVGAFVQSGQFSYSAPVTSPSPVYPSGFIETGQPIYPSLVSSVTIKFHYVFKSKLPHHVHGTVEFRALLLSRTDTWQNLSTIQPTMTFTGDQATVSSTLKLSALYSLISSVAAQTDVASSTFSADIQPVVHVTGEVEGNAINDTFLPVLPFAVTENVISLGVSAVVAPPGATYTLPTAQSEMASTLNPAQVGSTPHLVANVISVAKYQIRVPLMRVLGVIFVGLALVLVGLHEFFRRRHTQRSDEELIAARLHALIVPVSSLGNAQGRAPMDIPDFTHLAGLAQFLERPILYQMTAGTRTYAVDDDLQRYVFRPSGDSPIDLPESNRSLDSTPDPPQSGASHHGWDHLVQAASGSRTPTRSGRSIVARGGAVLVVAAIAASLVATFTASNTVPRSNAGSSLQPRLLSQLAPTGCASLNLTAIVQGSGAFANARSNVLVLGGSGSDTITDTGSGNCIVPGGGSDNVTGTATDICISGPTLNVAAPCPLANPSNGVSVVPTNSNFNNYGGQESLALTNQAAVTAMTIVIKVAQTSGISFNSQSNGFPGGYLTQSSSTAGGVITYSFVLAAGQVIPAGYANGTVYAQYSGTGAAHDQGGDTWSVTSTSKGTTSTLVGAF